MIRIVLLFALLFFSQSNESNSSKETLEEIKQSIIKDFFYDKSLTKKEKSLFVRDMLLLRSIEMPYSTEFSSSIFGLNSIKGKDAYEWLKNRALMIVGNKFSLQLCHTDKASGLCNLNDPSSLYDSKPSGEVLFQDIGGFMAILYFKELHFGNSSLLSTDKKQLPINKDTQAILSINPFTSKGPYFSIETYGGSLIRIAHYLGISKAERNSMQEKCETIVNTVTYLCDHDKNGPFFTTGALLDLFSSSCPTSCTEPERLVMKYLASLYYLRVSNNSEINRIGIKLLRENKSKWDKLNLNTNALIKIQRTLMATKDVY